jgi:hypothetical protein
MSGLFGGSTTTTASTVAASPPAAERSDSQTTALADSQRANYAKRRGRAMTMLTGGSGADSTISAVRYLGGAART